MTIQDLKNNLNESENIEIEVSYLFETKCGVSSYQDINRNSNYTFLIEKEEILQTLRQLYVSTKNNFIKKVVKSVGVSKRMSEKQLDLIVEELVNFNHITINF